MHLSTCVALLALCVPRRCEAITKDFDTPQTTSDAYIPLVQVPRMTMVSQLTHTECTQTKRERVCLSVSSLVVCVSVCVIHSFIQEDIRIPAAESFGMAAGGVMTVELELHQPTDINNTFFMILTSEQLVGQAGRQINHRDDCAVLRAVFFMWMGWSSESLSQLDAPRSAVVHVTRGAGCQHQLHGLLGE